MPLNYLITQNNREFQFHSDNLYDIALRTPESKQDFKMAFFKKYYEPIFGKIEKLEANTDEEKLTLAKTKVKEFMENSIVKINGQRDKNLLFTYDIVAKDVTGINFNDF
ncbi:UNVERIFIED_CONTAM: hypothetical protein O8I53_11560 [Campylobacter lari]